MDGDFRYTFRVAFHEVDRAGVLFFAHLFRHAHDAYEVWLAGRGVSLGELADGRPCRLPLVHAEADYLAPLRHGDEVGVALRVEAVGETSFTLGFELRGRDGSPCARLRTVHVAVDPSTQRPVALPGRLRDLLRDGGRAGTSADTL
jgi:1,4-dihydroxy-2-naphthoyl-CoA hydrolase